jgi:hypothetical protein
MKTIIGWCIIGIIGIGAWIWHAYNPYPIFYNSSGQIVGKQMAVWVDSIPITSANPTINISSAGFSKVLSVQVQILQPSASVTTFTWCNVTSQSTTAINLFLTQENSSTVNILGSIVLLGTPLQQPTTFSNVNAVVEVIGYK